MTSATTSLRGRGLHAPPFGSAGRCAATRNEVCEGGGFAPFQVRPGIDDGAVEEFEAALVRYCATTTGDVVVDGSDLQCIDGAGLRTLVTVARRLRPLGRRLVMRGFPASCWPAIECAGLGEQRRRRDTNQGAGVAEGDGTTVPLRSE